MNVKQQLAAAIKSAQAIVQKAQDEDRDLTADERTELKGLDSRIETLQAQVDDAKEDEALMQRLKSYGPPSDEDEGDREVESGAKSLGEHFVKAVGGEGLERIKSVSRAVVAAPEWRPAKAAGDTHNTPAVLAPWLTTLDRTIVRAFRRPVVSDLFGSGTLGSGSNAVTYLVEGAVEGAFGTVGAGGKKPQFHIGDPDERTDALKKIAGFIKFTDEMAEDADFWVSEINARGLYLLALAEEAQLMQGDGSGNNVDGLLNRSGIQEETSAGAVDNPDALFRAMSSVQQATGLTADALVINPTDYQGLRLNKDGNGQYFGGGYFAGQYGNGDIEWQPPVWGLRTVVSAAVDPGTAVVGAFGTAATVYRKGGVRVESTNSHAEDFTSNLITTRIEERVALAVRIPSAFVKVALSDEVGGGDGGGGGE